MTTLRAAAASAEILVSDLPAAADRPQEAPLRATALFIEGDAPLCIISCDVIGLLRDSCDEIAATISQTCRVPFDNVLVTCTHTHHAPRPMPVYSTPRIEEVCARTIAAAVDAAKQARTKLDAAESSGVDMLYALGQEATVGANSRWLMRDGQISWSHHDEAEMVRPTGPHDPDLPVLAFRRPSGKLAAALYCHATHNIGTLHPEPTKVISPGFFGLAAQEMERRHGAPFLYLAGAFGSSHRRDSHVKGPEAMTRVVNTVEEALGRLEPMPAAPMISIKRPYTCRYRNFDEAREADGVSRWVRRWFEPKSAECLERTYAKVRETMASKAGKTFETWLHVIRLGDLAIVGIPGEMFAHLGLDIRRRSPFRHTLVVGLANDEIGYIADRKGYELGGYQTWFCGHSQVGPGAGEAMVEAVLSLLAEIHAI
ncbi:MAG: hypothetical protein AB1696_14185 [Planctomycetota bacterium]